MQPVGPVCPPCHCVICLPKFVAAAAVPEPSNARAKQKAQLYSSSCLRHESLHGLDDDDDDHYHYYYIIVMMLFGSSLATALQPRNHHLEWGAKLGSWPPNWRTAAAGLRCEGTAPGFCQMCETNQNT